jgi:hypothetical protein
MTDISLPTPVLPIRSLWQVARIAGLLALALVAASASIRIEECRTVPGAFSSGFSLGFDVSRKVCGQSALAVVLANKAMQAIR